MLHIVNKSPAQTHTLASCLRLAQDGHALLLIEDGIYAATNVLAVSSGLKAALPRLAVYALQADVDARGMATRLIDGVVTVDYAGFVDLVTDHPNNQSWL